MDSLTFIANPELRQPFLVAAFAGWPDAAEVSTRAVSCLIQKLGAKRFATLSPEDFFDFAANRPAVTVKEGAVARLKMPSNDFYYWNSPTGGNDVVLLLGAEPQLKWATFSNTIAQLAVRLGVRRFYALGGVYHNVPHTRPARVTGIVNATSLKQKLREHGIGLVEYEGPASIHGPLLTDFSKAKIEMVNLWGHAPLYIRHKANPIVCHGMLRVLAPLLGVNIDLEEIKQASARMSHNLERAMCKNPHLRSYVRRLEEQHDAQAKFERPDKHAQQLIQEAEHIIRGSTDDGNVEG